MYVFKNRISAVKQIRDTVVAGINAAVNNERAFEESR